MKVTRSYLVHFGKLLHYLDTVTRAAEKDEYLGLETLVRSVPCTFSLPTSLGHVSGKIC